MGPKGISKHLGCLVFQKLPKKKQKTFLYKANIHIPFVTKIYKLKMNPHLTFYVAEEKENVSIKQKNDDDNCR